MGIFVGTRNMDEIRPTDEGIWFDVGTSKVLRTHLLCVQTGERISSGKRYQ
jgi:hypothetical protein